MRHASTHEGFIRHCLTVAGKGRGRVGNGAMVGSVLVRGDIMLAEGHHQAFGMPHAERQLLEKFDQKIDTKDILYVNLEPCVAHPSKKNLPCCESIVERGVRRLVYGMRDPDPRVAGRGIAYLMNAGVEVIGPVLPEECARYNRGFVSMRTKGRPWITLKSAKTKAGMIAQKDGQPLAITSQQQNAWSHTYLRARHDAILVGVGTVLTDNPSLTIRSLKSPPHSIRIILDPSLRIPVSSHVLTVTPDASTIIIASHDAIESMSERALRISERGARVCGVSYSQGRFDWTELWSVLTRPTPTYCGLTSLVVEGGKKTWDTFIESSMVDERVTLVGTA